MKTETQSVIPTRRKFFASAAKLGAIFGALGTIARGSSRSSLLRKEVIATKKAAPPVGPYSQAIKAGDFIFVAGEKGLDPRTGKIVPGGIAAETRQALENIQAILQAAGSSLDQAVSSVIYLTDIHQFGEMNKVYAEYFRQAAPGRTTVEVSALPAGANVEITITALRA